jgi:hypothetical protein
MPSATTPLRFTLVAHAIKHSHILLKLVFFCTARSNQCCTPTHSSHTYPHCIFFPPSHAPIIPLLRAEVRRRKYSLHVTCAPINQLFLDGPRYSVRTDDWRYTEWLRWDNVTLHGDFSKRVAVELYDHTNDDGTDPDVSENVNVAATADPSLLASLHTALVKGFPVV